MAWQMVSKREFLYKCYVSMRACLPQCQVRALEMHRYSSDPTEKMRK